MDLEREGQLGLRRQDPKVSVKGGIKGVSSRPDKAPYHLGENSLGERLMVGKECRAL